MLKKCLKPWNPIKYGVKIQELEMGGSKSIDNTARNEVFLTEYDICRRLSGERARREGREYTKPLTLKIEHDKYGRLDSKMNLTGKAGGSVTRGYTHLIAFALLKTERF